ncbi:MAG: GH92 family glycosyl hydrolase [Mucilaginibacter polytrichastri]|nr:GH92 family glycosyl hydrolase [Mucilaginibacter polytrichastri]
MNITRRVVFTGLILLQTASLLKAQDPETIKQRQKEKRKQQAADDKRRAKTDYTKFVNPFIGTGGHGHTFPGATMPFGMVQLSPDTRLEGWDGASGYFFDDTVVYGFSHTHLSGTGITDYMDFLFMPTTGAPQLDRKLYSSRFDKKNEEAAPGYYRTRLDKFNIDVELTATVHAGMQRYSYPKGAAGNVIIDLKHNDKVLDSWIEVISDTEIRGYRRSRSWAQDQHLYFYSKFSKPFKTFRVAENDQQKSGVKKAQGTNVKMYVQFDNAGDVLVKTGISAVSAENAQKNLDAEMPDFEFKKYVSQGTATWNKELSKIDVYDVVPQIPTQSGYGPYGMGGGQRQRNPFEEVATNKKTVFYTALYHCLTAPNTYSDVDGSYRGLDQKIHKADFTYYTVFSLWDTYRAEHPLLTLIDPKRTTDFIKTFLTMYEQSPDKQLPVWELSANESYIMVGNHAIPVIVDAWAKGIRGFDGEKALEAMKTAVNRKRVGYDLYAQYGFVPAEEKESVSKTLDYSYDDWCIAQMAKMLNKTDDYKEYIQRAQYWKNVYDPQFNFVNARVNGGWFSPFRATDVNENYTEGNSWVYTFSVPQDVNTLTGFLGGKDKLEAKLDLLFNTSEKLTGNAPPDITGLMGQYAHGNEPSHHIAYLYNFTNNTYKTQYYLRRIMLSQYRNAPDGLSGNEDCGQMSAWFVMTSLGLYNIQPGQNDYQIGIPFFQSARIRLDDGKTFTITAPGSGTSSYYLQGMTLNDQSYNKLFLPHSEVQKGGEFEVVTGRLENKLYMEGLEKPVSQITDDLITPAPFIIYDKPADGKPGNASFGCVDKDAKIYYTTDGAEPTENSTPYTAPFAPAENSTVRFIAVKNGVKSKIQSSIAKKPEVQPAKKK